MSNTLSTSDIELCLEVNTDSVSDVLSALTPTPSHKRLSCCVLAHQHATVLYKVHARIQAHRAPLLYQAPTCFQRLLAQIFFLAFCISRRFLFATYFDQRCCFLFTFHVAPSLLMKSMISRYFLMRKIHLQPPTLKERALAEP